MTKQWRTPNRALADILTDAINAEHAQLLQDLAADKWLITGNPPAPPEGFYVPWEAIQKALQ